MRDRVGGALGLALGLAITSGCAVITVSSGPRSSASGDAYSSYCTKLLTASIVDTVGSLVIVPSAVLAYAGRTGEPDPELFKIGAIGTAIGVAYLLSAVYGYSRIGPCRERARALTPTPAPAPAPAPVPAP